MQHQQQPDAGSPRPRARAIGIPFDGVPGPWNAITDVPGVEVGYETLIDGDGPLVQGLGPVRTGVTGTTKAGVGEACGAAEPEPERAGGRTSAAGAAAGRPVSTYAAASCHALFFSSVFRPVAPARTLIVETTYSPSAPNEPSR